MSRFTISNKFSRALIISTVFSLGLAQANAAVPIVQGSLSGNAVSNSSSNPAVPNSANQAADAQGSTLWKLYQQVQQLQQEIRELRGQLEAQQNGLDRTQKDLKNRYTDLDQRLELLKDQAEGNSSDSEPDNTPSDDSNSDTPNDSTPQPVNAPAQPTPPSKGNLYVQQQPATSVDADKNAYIGAYDVYKVGGAAKAIKPMQQFIVDFPTSVYVPNAYYWLGEFHLASNPADFTKAKKSFNEVVNKYPKSAKASTALYRIATISQEIDKRPQEALALMKKLSQNYPNSTEAQYANSFIKTYSK